MTVATGLDEFVEELLVEAANAGIAAKEPSIITSSDMPVNLLVNECKSI